MCTRPCARSTCTTATSTTWCKNGEVTIVDEFTGRLMTGRRWSDGLPPGGRGQGRRTDPEREPDAGQHHLPELLPHVRQAVGHDRHGRHRGLRIPGDLRPGDRGDSAEQAHDPQGRARPGLQDQPREVRSRHQGHSRLPRARPAGARGHDFDREFRADLGHARQGKVATPGAQTPSSTPRRPRSLPRPADRGVITIATNMAGRGTDIVLGGQRREPDQDHRRRRLDRRRRQGCTRKQAACRVAGAARCRESSRRVAHHRHRTATNRAASTTSYAAARARQGRPGVHRASTCRWTIR